MRYFPIPILIVVFLTIPGLFSSHSEPAERVETFKIQADIGLRLSIENSRQAKGWVPVIVSVGNLELLQRLSFHHPVLASDDFSVYEQNPVRTRMRVKGEKSSVILLIDWHHMQGEFYIGEGGLKLNPIHLSFKETPRAGLYLLSFSGDGVSMYATFLITPLKGIIYMLPNHKPINETNLHQAHTWAVRIKTSTMIREGKNER